MEIDHITSGDLMTAITILIGVALSTWATLITSALIFRRKAEYARGYFEKSPGISIFLGIVIGGVSTGIALALLQVPNPAVKLAAWVMLSSIAAIAALGGAGLALLAGSRIESMESGSNGFSALARGSGLMVLVGMVPFFGWFAYIPVVVLASFGAGLQALVYRPSAAPSLSGLTPGGSAQ